MRFRKSLRVALEAHFFTMEEEASGKGDIAKAATAQPDLVVLDLGLPDMDDKAVIARIREWSQAPILILSVRQAEEEKVAALDADANYYVVKPFGIAEMLARERALLRSASGGAALETEIVRGDLRIDLARNIGRRSPIANCSRTSGTRRRTRPPYRPPSHQARRRPRRDAVHPQRSGGWLPVPGLAGAQDLRRANGSLPRSRHRKPTFS